MAGLALGALGFASSFVLAAFLLLREGNPGFFLIWLLAVVATAACMRVHARARRAFERLYASCSSREMARDVQDVVFRELPAEAGWTAESRPAVLAH